MWRRRLKAAPEIQNASVTGRPRRARRHRLRSGPATRAEGGTMHRGICVLVMGWSSNMQGNLRVRRAARIGRI